MNNSQLLPIARDFSLPADVATEAIAIVARRGAGKTYTARKLTEGLLTAGIPVCVVDPIGVWWGLRSSSDGKGEGLPIYILGGEHADAPLTPESGPVVADMVNAQHLSCVLDLSLMRKGERTRFMTAFAERLYHIRREAIHLVVDEADEFAPQRTFADEARLLGAMEDLVRRGRARGIGMTMITQRPSVINKNVLTQCEILIALQMSHNLDLKAVDEWIKLHGSEDKRAEFLKTVPSLQKGEAWVWSPSFLDVFKRIKVDRCRTFDSSATPKTGAKASAPKKLAAVNLDVLREQMAAQIRAAENDDPVRLRKQIAELERKLNDARAPLKNVTDAFAAFVGGVIETLSLIDTRADELSTLIAHRLRTVEEYQTGVLSGFMPADLTKFVMPKEATQPVVPKSVSAPTVKTEQKYTPEYTPPEARAVGEVKLQKAHRAMLRALIVHGPLTKSQLAIIADYSASSGSFRNALAYMRARALIVDQGLDLVATTAGHEAYGEPTATLPPWGTERARWWLDGNILNKCEKAILRVVVDHWPRAMEKEEIAQRAQYEASSGSFRNSMAKLRTLELLRGFSPIELAPELQK